MRTFFTILNVLYFCFLAFLCDYKAPFTLLIGFTLGLFYSKLEEINETLKLYK
jgi:hypothetical protein